MSFASHYLASGKHMDRWWHQENGPDEGRFSGAVTVIEAMCQPPPPAVMMRRSAQWRTENHVVRPVKLAPRSVARCDFFVT
jgi:hypothetical protein